MAELTTAQAAAVAGVPERTLRRWVTSGQLPAIRRGRWYRIRPEDLAAIGVTNGQERPEPSATGAAGAAMAEGMAEHLAELVRLVEKLTQQNMELAGRVGFYQAQVQQLRAALEAPRSAEVDPGSTTRSEAAPEPATRPWWRFWWG
jgi:excisionase family DNA binding protein